MIFVNTSFKGYYPVGTAAVVCAPNAQEAAELLNTRLECLGLVQEKKVKAEDMVKFTAVPGNVEILADGNY